MSWFHRDHGGKVQPILRQVEHSTILGAEVADGGLSRLCYTGHAGSIEKTGIVQAVVPGGEMLWRTSLANESDLYDGHVVTHGDVVVTRIAHPRGHELIGHDLWTGAERWRLPVAQMVTRMGIDGGGAIVFVTYDHAVHAVEIATGVDHPREPVKTEQAADAVIRATRHPVQGFQRGYTRTGGSDWSTIHNAGDQLEVYERDWAGASELGIGFGDNIHMVGAGSFQGWFTVGAVSVLGFRIGVDGAEHHHWYLYATRPALLLAVLREDGKSIVYRHGHVVWNGKL